MNTQCVRNVHVDARLKLDECALAANEKTNKRIDEYYQYNPIADCSSKEYMNIAECNNFVPNNGYGYTNGCVVDVDSRLRNGQEINTKFCVNEQYRSCDNGGDCNVNMKSLENRMKRGNNFGMKRCDVLSEVDTLDLQLIPLIPCLAHQIQNPNNLVESGWVRGGAPTRDVLEQKKFLESQGVKFVQGIPENSCGF
jgi:hypothetical protein